MRRRYFTILASLLIVTALALSLWQFARLQWKTELISQLHVRAEAPTQDLVGYLDDHKDISNNHVQFRRFSVTGQPLYDSYLLQFGRDKYGVPSLQIILPVVVADDLWVLINVGSIAADEKEAAESVVREFQSAGTTATFSGIARPYTSPPWFSPEQGPSPDTWLFLEADKIAAVLGLSSAATPPFYLLADATSASQNSATTPSWTIDVPNNHLEYALTWLAIALGMTFMTFLWRRENK